MLIRVVLTYLIFTASSFAIVGGELVGAKDYESVVALVRRGKAFCTGVALSQNHILTAAHCLESKKAHTIKVYTGAGKDLSNTRDYKLNAQYSVKKAFIHPSVKFQFPGGPIENLADVRTVDLAILELWNPLRIPRYYSLLTNPVDVYNYLRPGNLTTAVGYGYTGELGFLPYEEIHDDVSYGQKRKAQIPVYGTSFNYLDMRNKETDTCYVDSGGPIFVDVNGKRKIAAIVSASLGFCAEGKYATLYALTYHAACWINDVAGVEDEFTNSLCDREYRIESKCFHLKDEDEILRCANGISNDFLSQFIE
ncbi:S1 family peptidase [Halobacteriovorax sp. DPLXC-1]|uniref:S1 family peptidase n=1 Tax=Halobacteriovorax sp. DPLXC-1 TaxID=3110771 RepID=UPI002FF3C59A